MTYDNFLNYIVNTFQMKLGPDSNVRIQKVIKNNNVHLEALTISREDEFAAPSIYLNGYYEEYEQGKPLGSIVADISDVYDYSRTSFHINSEDIVDFNRASRLIAYKLINARDNEAYLASVPHIPYHDLAIVFYLLLEGADHENATAVITTRHMNMWGSNLDALFDLACANTPRLLKPVFMPLRDMLRELLLEDLRKQASDARLHEDLPEDCELSEETLEGLADSMLLELCGPPGEIDMYCISNDRRLNGAAAILYPGFMKEVSLKLGGSYYLLPCSIHEMIALKDDKDIDPIALENMVVEINNKEVALTDKLSDTIYYYDAERDSIKQLSALQA
ncbi:MAG: DUF5688 family protein [Lachnospiraceae bacterium]